MSLEGWLVWVNRVYFAAGGVAALATAATVVAGLAQSRLNDKISERKDRELAEFRLASEATVAELQKQTAQANQKAEEDRLARMKIEQRLAPRSLDEKQKDAIRTMVAPFSGTSLDVIACGDTREIGNLIASITGVLQAAGWKVRVWAAMGGAGLSVAGVPIQTQVGSDPLDNRAANAVVAALRASGIESGIVEPFNGTDVPMALTGPVWDQSTVAKVRMLVGSKP